MAFTPMSDDLNIIQSLSDTPNQTEGLTSTQLKIEFDEGPNTIKAYINGTLIAELDALQLTVDALVSGTVPDNSVTESKLAVNTKVIAMKNTLTMGGMV